MVNRIRSLGAAHRLPARDATSKVGVFIQLSGGLAGPDGLALDEEGGLNVAHPGIGVWRFDRMWRPTHLVSCQDGAMWTNIAFGGADNTELHIADSMAGAVYVAAMPCAGREMHSHAEGSREGLKRRPRFITAKPLTTSPPPNTMAASR